MDGWKEVTAVVRETLIRAFRDQGLKCEEAYPAAFSNGHEARQWLMDWLQKTRLPVLTLVDIKTLGENPDDFIAHWGLVFAASNSQVRMASWHKMQTYSWETFMASWAMPYLPYPNNYYQMRVWA